MADEEHVKLYARVSAQQFLMKRLLAQMASENAEEDDPWELLEGLKSEIVASWPKTPEEGENLTDEILGETLLAVQEIIVGAQELVGEPEGDSYDDDGEEDEDDDFEDDEDDYLEEDEYRDDEDDGRDQADEPESEDAQEEKK